jgi:hypothetical protein
MYAKWMAFAHRLQVVVQTVLFTVIYLFIVPLFALVAILGDTMRLRRRPAARTFWVPRRDAVHDDKFFERM